jgi:hypothetical protein
MLMIALARITIAIALLFAPIIGAQGADRWIADSHRCTIAKTFTDDDSPEHIWSGNDGNVTVVINTDEIKDLEKAIHNLKICKKFWDCTLWRDGIEAPPKGVRRPKHCYESIFNGWKD